MKRCHQWLALPIAAVAVIPLITAGPASSGPEIPKPTKVYPVPSAQFAPITVLSIGDSLTYGTDGSATASYRAELSRLMNNAGQPHQWRVAAQGGTNCAYWADRINNLITQHSPNLIILNCGTNDTPTSNVEAALRTIFATAQARGVQIAGAFIGIPDMRSPENRARTYIYDWMHNTNEAVKHVKASYPNAPFADNRRIPATLEWLQSDGIHWTDRANKAAAQLIYQAVRASRGWRTLQQMFIEEACGLSGASQEDPEPIPNVDYNICAYS